MITFKKLYLSKVANNHLFQILVYNLNRMKLFFKNNY